MINCDFSWQGCLVKVQVEVVVLEVQRVVCKEVTVVGEEDQLQEKGRVMKK